jgi:hypothetical protein
VLLHAGKRSAEARALIGWGGTANGLIKKDVDQRAALRRTPGEQGGPLCFRTERLVAGAHAHIADDLIRVAWES